MRKYFKAFTYAWSGVLHGVKAELNMKSHLIAAIVVIFVGFYTGLSVIEWSIVVLLIGGMLALEMVNAAVERVVDLVTLEKHPLAKQAKDLAAGAVLVYAISSAVIGLIIFVPKWFN